MKGERGEQRAECNCAGRGVYAPPERRAVRAVWHRGFGNHTGLPRLLRRDLEGVRGFRLLFLKIDALPFHQTRYRRSLSVIEYLCENGINFVGTIIRTRQNALCFDFDAAVAALFAWVDGENVETDETKTPEYQMLCKIYRLTKPGLGIPGVSFSDDAAVRFYEQWDALKRAPQTDAKGENRPLRRAARPLCRALPAASGRVLSDARGRRREFLRRKRAELYPGLGRSHVRVP